MFKKIIMDKELTADRLKNYKTYPMSEIHEEARLIAVRWIEDYEPTGGFDLPNKVKLASDIMNFAEHYATQREQKAVEKVMDMLEKQECDIWDDLINRDQAIQSIIIGNKRKELIKVCKKEITLKQRKFHQ